MFASAPYLTIFLRTRTRNISISFLKFKGMSLLDVYLIIVGG
jgi:hypothetical protein